MKVIRRIRVLAIIALVWWLFAVGKMVAVGSTDGQLPLVIATGLLIALAFWIQGSGRTARESVVHDAPPRINASAPGVGGPHRPFDRPLGFVRALLALKPPVML